MSRERHILNRIQEQADKIKEMETTFSDEKAKLLVRLQNLEKSEQAYEDELKKNKSMRKMFDWVELKLKDNHEYQQLKADIIGGKEEEEC